MKVVLLTALSPEGQVQHRYVAHSLVEAFGDELRAIIVTDGARAPLGKRLKRWWKRYTVPQLLSRTLIKARDSRKGRNEDRQATYRRILFPAGEDGRMPQGVVRAVPSHNGKACLRILRDLQPDVIAVYGTVVIKGDVIAAAGKSIINMHTGLSPRYRGSDTIFWPLHNGEPEWVGVTIHRLTPGIDAGPILATARPIIAADDGEDSLFAKCVQVGCEHFITAIREEAEGVAEVMPQQLEKGREYRSVERTVTAERRAEKQLREGLLARYAERGA